MFNDKKICAVLPAYNAALTLRATLADIPRPLVDDVILVDDASQDNTAEVSRALGIFTVIHQKNVGYGGNQKTCYRLALERGADITVMVHPDHQYDPHYIRQLVEKIDANGCDAVFGSRMLIPGAALHGGMPRWKYYANIGLTFVANTILGLSLSEYHSGFRAYTRKTLENIPYEKNSNNFVFDTEIIIQIRRAHLSIKEIPIPTRYFKEASSIGFWKSVEYGISILGALMKYLVRK